MLEVGKLEAKELRSVFCCPAQASRDLWRSSTVLRVTATGFKFRCKTCLRCIERLLTNYPAGLCGTRWEMLAVFHGHSG